MLNPREPHLTVAKRILQYLQGTLDYGSLLHRTSMSDLVVCTDVDWASCTDTCRSTSGYAVFLGDNLVTWSSKRQNVVSRLSAEAEYHVVANGVTEAYWLRRLLGELHSRPLWSTATTSTPSTSPPTPFSTSAPSMLRLIFTLSTSALPSGMFVSFTFRRLLSSPTSSPRGCPPRCSQSFGPVSTSAVAIV
jgi:hypothetical protein